MTVDTAAFIAQCVPGAQASQLRYGVPASVTIAQAILESGWGRSDLATRASNFFGIKCSAQASPHQVGCVNRETWEHLNGNDVTVTASFRRYASMTDSFLDHGLFLTSRPRYAAAFEPGIGADEFARRIHAAGYATDPNYSNKLISLMDQYGLRQYDQPKEAAVPRVFLSPSDQDNNPVHGGGNEQQYAQIRCRAAADVLRNHGIEVKISEAGIGDDSRGFEASIAEGNAWGPDLYIADHSNAVSGPVKRRGVHMYVWPGSAEGRRVAELIIAETRPIFGGPDYPTAILDGSHLGEVQGTEAPAVLMELGFHDHPEDAAIIRTRSPQIGAAVGTAIARYFGKITSNDNQEEDVFMSAEVIEVLRRIEQNTIKIWDELTDGQEGVKHTGQLYGQIVALRADFGKLAAAGSGRDDAQDDAIAQLRADIEAKLAAAQAAFLAALDEIRAMLPGKEG